MSKIFDGDLTASTAHQPTTLDLIDTARAAAKRAAHACHDPQARSAAQIITDVRSAHALFAAISAKPLQPNIQ